MTLKMSHSGETTFNQEPGQGVLNLVCPGYFLINMILKILFLFVITLF